MDLLKIKSLADVQRTLRTNPMAVAEPLWHLLQEHHRLKMENVHLLKTVEETAQELAQMDIEVSKLREGLND